MISAAVHLFALALAVLLGIVLAGVADAMFTHTDEETTSDDDE